MTLYRGPGGTGSATSDADTTLYQDFLNQTIAARDAALQAEINAELAETNAETAETNAETAETNAETAATNAASSASAAASSASSASTSASNASTSASAASTSATAAASSASSASSSASAASTSASNAATSATNAANSASSASTSATNAANSASTATTQATNAAASATAAASSASSASTSATNAANSASSASTSATNAATSATSAAASASAAAASAASIDPTTLVRTTGTQTIGGDKTFSSNPTLSAGTANGVLFLNAGKAIASGTAFSFDGSSVTVKTSSGGYLNLDSTAAGTSNTIASLLNNSAAYAPLNYNATAHVYQISSSEGMRLTSTGLGIGTSSPVNKLHAKGGNGSQLTLDNAGEVYSGLDISNNGTRKAFVQNHNTNNLLYLGSDTGGIAFFANGAERARIDSSGNLTLNSASVNGVAYFNGSKVLTTGSALTFDGTSFANALNNNTPKNIAVSYSSVPVYLSNSFDGSIGISTLSNNTWNNSNGSSSWAAFQNTGYSASAIQLITSTGASDIRFLTAGAANTNPTEQMRLTSTGLGIGTSSPAVKLDVYGSGAYLGQFIRSTSGVSGGGISVGNQSRVFTMFTDSAGWSLYDNTAGAQRMLMSADGNLGLGVTPSASWFSGSRVLQFGATGALWNNSSNNTAISHNAIFSDATTTYQTTGAASYYRQLAGAHNWFTAPSGTAGNAISFTQAMTLDASGNLGIGTTSPATRMHISGGPLRVDDTNIMFLNPNYASGVMAVQGFSNAALAFCTNNTERARIDSSGNFFVGAAALTSNATYFAMSPGNGFADFGHVNGSASGLEYTKFLYNATKIGSITQNGTTGVLYNLTSDYRLKNNPVALTGAKAFVMALRPKTWDWWDGSGKGVGFIAHEFMEVAKYSGNGKKDAVDADGKPVYQSIQPSSSEVMANLVALIQEQQNTIDQLKARLDAANL